MKRLYFTLIALIATLVASAQTIKVYGYDSNGNLKYSPLFISSDKVKVVFTDAGSQEQEYVDLGLPSGTLWATCNIGASKPEEYGDYFAWGETEPKEKYPLSTYKWCDGSETSLTKYCTNSDYGTLDNKTVLDPEDDAATVNWGSDWCMPTRDQLRELYSLNYTTTEWTTQNGVNGYKITSKQNGKSIFLPAAGAYDEDVASVGEAGFYWSRTLDTQYTFYANLLVVMMENSTPGIIERYFGLSVRPVRKEKADRHEYVDLGLPSGTLWATCNVGANSPEEFGDYFAWGETKPKNKNEYTWSNYKWCNGSENTLTKYCINSEYGVVDDKMILDPEDDAATVNWGSNWRMPTGEQIKELFNTSYTTAEYTTMNDMPILKVTSKKNGNVLILPPAGSYCDWWGEGSDPVGIYETGVDPKQCEYKFWSCEHQETLNGKRGYHQDYATYFWGIGYISNFYPLDNLYFDERSNGLPVRPVRVKK